MIPLFVARRDNIELSSFPCGLSQPQDESFVRHHSRISILSIGHDDVIVAGMHFTTPPATTHHKTSPLRKLLFFAFNLMSNVFFPAPFPCHWSVCFGLVSGGGKLILREDLLQPPLNNKGDAPPLLLLLLLLHRQE